MGPKQDELLRDIDLASESGTKLKQTAVMFKQPSSRESFDQIMLKGCRCRRNFGVIHSLQVTSNGCFSLQTAGSCLYMRKIICQKLELAERVLILAPHIAQSVEVGFHEAAQKMMAELTGEHKAWQNTVVFQSIKSLLHLAIQGGLEHHQRCHEGAFDTFHCLCGPPHRAHRLCKQSKLV